jgi:hypothetical protein
VIKTRKVTVEDVLCDICGKDTGYAGDTAYATSRVKHFCHEHSKVGDLFESLLDMNCRKTAVMFFEEYMGMPKENV